MNKRGLLAILVFCMILGIVPFFSLPVQAEKTMTWQDAYFELLDNPSMQHEVIDSLLTIKDPLFAIRDIDNNGIPELIIRWDPVDLPGIYEIFTYSNGVKK